MEVRLLGPVELWSHGAEVKLPATKLKQLLAVLAWNTGKVLSTDALVQCLWDDERPARELTSLYANISRLRACLRQCADPQVELQHAAAGYRLAMPAEYVDLARFRRSISLAHDAAEQGRPEEAARLLQSAQGLVHGEPLTGLPGEWAGARRAELDETILAAALSRIEAQLEAAPGDARTLLSELRALTARHEHDEALLALRMRALHTAGRTLQALEAYNAFRRRLAERTGLDPSARTQALHAQLLRDTPGANHPAPSARPSRLEQVPAGNTLEREQISFVGRRDEFEGLSTEIRRQLDADTSPVCVIDGAPGLGKSALALHLAHHLRTLCPDGAFQLHLRGHDPIQPPTQPEAALDILLTMIGESTRQIQASPGLDYSIALWRRHTAGKRILLLLDDVLSDEQIAPLLPNTPGSIVLVTSRMRLTGQPDAIRHGLEPMGTHDAQALLMRAASLPSTSGPILDEVIATCGGFPLALAIVGNTLRAHPAWSLADLAEQLADADHSSHSDVMLAPLYRALATSCKDLPPLERTMLRRLSLNPGTRIHLRAAAALADAPIGPANTALLNLVEHSLLNEPKRSHYQLHDMVRQFAARLRDNEEDPAELRAASDRLVRHTLGAVYTATKLFHPDRHVLLASAPPLDPTADGYGIATALQAQAWLDSEQAWLRAAVEHWSAAGYPQQAAALVHMMAKYIDRRGLWRDYLELAEDAAKTWKHTKNPTALAHALTDLATAHWRLGDLERALANGRSALRYWQQLDDPNGQADALLQLGRAQYSRHHLVAAVAYFQRCAILRDQQHDAQPLAVALQHLGPAEFDVGQYEQGIATMERALDLARAAHDETIERNCINSLGEFWLTLGDYARAEQSYRQALLLADHIADKRGAAICTLNLGSCQLELGRPAAAVPLLDRALEMFRDLGHTSGQISVLTAQARTYLRLHRLADARTRIDAAASLAEDLADPLQLSRVHATYGEVHTNSGQTDVAVFAYRTALLYARRSGSALVLAGLHHRLGDLNEKIHGPGRALRYWRKAVLLYADVPSQDAKLLRQKLAELGHIGEPVAGRAPAA